MHDRRAPTPREQPHPTLIAGKGDSFGNGQHNALANGDGQTMDNMISRGDGWGVGEGVAEYQDGDGRH